MLNKIADHVRGLIREAQESGADEQLVGDTHALVDNVRNGHIEDAVPVLARDSDYGLAFEYLLGVADGRAAALGGERPHAVQAAADEADEGRVEE